MSVDGILRGAIERLDMKILLYPFEEQFDVPALSVEFCDCQGFVPQMVGKEAIKLTSSEVFISDHSESFGIALGWLDSCQFDNLIADYAGFGITPSGLDNSVKHVVFRPSYEECSVLVDVVEEPEEINITFVQKIDGPHLNAESIKSLDIMHRGICEVDIDRKIASKIQESMHLYTSFSCSELCPWTKLQTKACDAAIEGANHIVNVKPKRIFCIQGTDSFYESLTKVPIYTPVPLLVRFCESIPWNRVTDAAVVQLVLNCNQTRLNVSKTVLLSVLRKTHHEKLIVAGQIPATIISLVSSDACAEVPTRYKLHKLSKYGFSSIHRRTNRLVSLKLRFESCTRKHLCN